MLKPYGSIAPLKPAVSVVGPPTASPATSSILKMPGESPFDVAQAFEPFDERDARRIRRYAERTKRLGECRLIRESLSLDVKFGNKRGQTGVRHGGDERDRSHFLFTFRPLFLPTEESGFLQVAALIREHAEKRDGEDAAKAAAMVAEYEEGLREALVTSNVMEIRVEGGAEILTPAKLFKLWLYGEGFHVDDDKAAYLEQLTPIERSTFQFSYLASATSLARMYCRFGTFPNAILAEPSLLPAVV